VGTVNKSMEEYMKGQVYINLGLCNLRWGGHICNDALSNEGIILYQYTEKHIMNRQNRLKKMFCVTE